MNTLFAVSVYYFHRTYKTEPHPMLLSTPIETVVFAIARDVDQTIVGSWVESLLTTIEYKILICLQDPLFRTITHGSISGQMVLKNGIPTGEFSTIDSLQISRANGTNRYVKLIPITLPSGVIFGYKTDVEAPCSLGLDQYFLSDIEKEFYRNFIITPLEPSHQNLAQLIYDEIGTPETDKVVNWGRCELSSRS